MEKRKSGERDSESIQAAIWIEAEKADHWGHSPGDQFHFLASQRRECTEEEWGSQPAGHLPLMSSGKTGSTRELPLTPLTP